MICVYYICITNITHNKHHKKEISYIKCADMCLHTYIHIRKHVSYKIWTTCITGAYIICIITRKTKYISKIRYKIGWIYLNSYFIYSVYCILYISYMIHIIYELKHSIVHRINHCIYHLICECTKYIMSYKCHFCMYIYICIVRV